MLNKRSILANSVGAGWRAIRPFNHVDGAMDLVKQFTDGRPKVRPATRSSLNVAQCAVIVTFVLLAGGIVRAQTENRFDNAFRNDQQQTAAANAPAFDNGSAPPVPPEDDQVATAPAEVPESATEEVPSTEKRGSANVLIKMLEGAGLMAFPIMGCSILLVMFALERAISLRRPRVIPKHFVKLFLSELEGGNLKPAEALELCEENASPISEVFAAAVKKWNRPSVEVEQAVLDAGERVANGLRRYLRLFNGISTVSPLLGLLGTVLGMIEAFNAIASSDAMGKPEVLASGISQALLTTAGGLSVAIPAFIVYMYFTSRVDRLIIEIDNLGQKAVFAIGSDAWKQPAKTKKAA